MRATAKPGWRSSGRRVITFDTSGVLALANRRDPNHEAAANVLRQDRGPYLIPAGVLAEITFMLTRRLGTRVLDVFLTDLEAGRYTLDCGDEDFARIRELVKRYDDLPLGAADASVVACAERSGGRVLTLDLRDFGVVARDARITLLPEVRS